MYSVGGGQGKYYTVNVPLREGVQDDQYYSVFTGVLSEVKDRYQPECVLLQCGADMLSGDPLGEFSLTPLGAGRCISYVLHWKLPTLLLGGGEIFMSETSLPALESYQWGWGCCCLLIFSQLSCYCGATVIMFCPCNMPGGYHFANTARLWTLGTALAVGQQLTNEIPEHKVCVCVCV